MAKFNERLRELRTARGLSQSDIAKLLRVSKSSINMYERGEREPNFETLESIADCFNVDMDYLMGKSDFPNKSAWLVSMSAPPEQLPSNVIPAPSMRQIPLYGAIACGVPILAVEDPNNMVDLPAHIHADFALICKGDSMINARIYDGDIVYIRRQDSVDNGEIAAVLIDDEATLKRVQLFPDHIVLEPENPQYRPLVYWESEMNDVRILGRAVAFTSAVL